MSLIRISPDWQLPEKLITSESAFVNRRKFIKQVVGAGLAASILPLQGCDRTSATFQTTQTPYPNLAPNPNFLNLSSATTPEDLATRYNNYYEFGGSKSIWEAAQNLPTDNWRVEVSGLVKNPRTYDIDDLHQKFPLQERIYRFRCVEAWAMVVP